MEKLNQDSPLHLADALADEIAKTPAQTLLAEVAEDLGERRALADEFDAVAARALRQSRRNDLTAAIKNAGTWLWQRAFGRPVLVRFATLAVLVVAVGGYFYHDAQRAVAPMASLDPPAAPRSAMPRSFSAYTNDGPADRQESAGANRPAAPMPSPSPQAQSDLRQALAAYDTARASEARARATEAFDRGDYAAAVTSLNDALVSCADRCQPELRGGLDADLERAQTALNKNTPAAAAAPAQSAVHAAAAVAPAKSLLSLAWPVKGHISINFGARTALAVADAPAQTSEGITMAVTEGADVRAAADGIVSFVGDDKKSGKFVQIRHDDDLKTGYGRLHRVLVKASDQVHRGEVIAKGVERGAGAQPQFYFEVRRGAAPVDPMQYLPQDQQPQNTNSDSSIR